MIYNIKPASTSSMIGFFLILIFIVTFFYLFRRHGLKNQMTPKAIINGTLLRLVVFIGPVVGIVASGLPQSHPFPVLPITLGYIFVHCFWYGFSKEGMKLVTSAPLWAIVGFQAFRFPLELVLHQWFLEGVIPGTMTWSGENWDIGAGVLCLASSIWLKIKGDNICCVGWQVVLAFFFCLMSLELLLCPPPCPLPGL